MVIFANGLFCKGEEGMSKMCSLHQKMIDNQQFVRAWRLREAAKNGMFLVARPLTGGGGG